MQETIEMQDFTVLIPNKTNSGILKEVIIQIPIYYDEEIKGFIITDNGLTKIDYTKTFHMFIENVIDLQEYIQIMTKLSK